MLNALKLCTEIVINSELKWIFKVSKSPISLHGFEPVKTIVAPCGSNFDTKMAKKWFWYNSSIL